MRADDRRQEKSDVRLHAGARIAKTGGGKCGLYFQVENMILWMKPEGEFSKRSGINLKRGH